MSSLAPAYVSPLETSVRGDTASLVFLEDQTSQSLYLPFLQNRIVFGITAPTTIDTRTFTATGGHGILAGQILEFSDGNIFMVALVLSVSVNNITIDTPFNHSYKITDLFFRATDDLLVDGSVTPKIFSLLPTSGQSGDIISIIIVITSTMDMDFTKFGSQPPLTNGCVLRVKLENGDFTNLLNFKTNGEFIHYAFTHEFESKSGGGEFGFVAEATLGGQENSGVVIRLDGDLNEEFQIIIQDDLTSGLTSLRLFGLGHEVPK